MTAGEIMSRPPLVTARETDDLDLAAELLLWGGVRHLPVLRGGQVVGMVGARDLLVSGPRGVRNGTMVRDIMRSPVWTVGRQEELAHAVALMAEHRVSCLPVLAEDELVGILTSTDVLARQAREALPELGPVASPVAAQVMHRHPATVAREARLLDAVWLMRDRNVRHLPVTDADGRLVGMVSDRDVRAAVGDPAHAVMDPVRRGKLADMTVSSTMSPHPASAREDEPLASLAQRLADHRIGALPILSPEGRVSGIVSYVDLLRAFH